MLKLALYGSRILVSLFSGVVLGLSITLAKQQVLDSPPSETSFSSFAGAFGIIVTLIGLASISLDKIPYIVVLVADTLAALFYLAAGIALTIALKSVSSCTSGSSQARADRYQNKLLNGGCYGEGQDLTCPNAGSGNTQDDIDSYTSGRCQSVQADYVFEYLAFALGLAIVTMTYFMRRKGGVSSSTYV